MVNGARFVADSYVISFVKRAFGHRHDNTSPWSKLVVGFMAMGVASVQEAEVFKVA
jgi:hypothetical protein